MAGAAEAASSTGYQEATGVHSLLWLLIAIRFVSPTQLVSRVREQPAHA